jgi:hypothetical protein
MSDHRYDIANRVGDKALGEDGKIGHGTGRVGLAWWLAFALCVLFFLWTLLPGVLTLIAGTDADIPEWLLVATGGGVLAIGGMLLMSGMWIAELARRGSITKSADPRAQGTFGVRFSLLATPLHLTWFVGLLVLAAMLLAIPMLADGDTETFMTWFIWGVFMVPVAGAVLGSLVKKTFYFRWHRRQIQAAGGRVVRKPQPFWRWFSYRWRIDLWLCGAGFLAVAGGLFIAAMMEFLPEGDFGGAEDIAEATTVVIVLLGSGVPTLLFALWACTQFWRSGEDINTGESAS